jgi:uncharacterized protein YndB with AHSA1/START domain
MTAKKTMAVSIERRILGTPGEVYDAWLDPSVPGAFGHENEQLIIDLKPEGLWYWRSRGGTPHYGRFLELSRPARIQHSWMSPNTLGQDSVVTVTFEQSDGGTKMKIVHSDLPNAEMAAAHGDGWKAILESFSKSASKGGHE